MPLDLGEKKYRPFATSGHLCLRSYRHLMEEQVYPPPVVFDLCLSLFPTEFVDNWGKFHVLDLNPRDQTSFNRSEGFPLTGLFRPWARWDWGPVAQKTSLSSSSFVVARHFFTKKLLFHEKIIVRAKVTFRNVH